MSFLEATAVIFGLICVWLTIRQNIWCWPIGLIQVVLYIFIFYNTKLYSDMVLHIIYVFLSIYGWYNWLKEKNRAEKFTVRLTGKWLGVWIIFCFLTTAVLGYFMDIIFKASSPYPDAFIAVASICAQWLMARKKLESWVFWIVIDIVAIGVYVMNALYFTAALYAVFLAMAAIGFLAWRKFLVNHPAPITP